MCRLPDIARATVARHNMLSAEPVVLAMVSGGADSVALLRLLAEGALGPLGDLRVLHVNHGLRGADADADEAFVVSLAGSLGLACETVRYDVAAYAEAEGLNLEDAGRRVRYRFAGSALDAACDALDRPRSDGRIAVAHTLDDRMETFCARLVSGAGGTGLRSVPPVRGRIVRPLIEARREAVVAYLRSLGQAWREDVTNQDVSRERAWVRHELLPLITGREPSFPDTLSRTLTILADEDSMLAEMADAFAHDFTRSDGEALAVDRALLATLSRPMARRTLRTAVLRAFPDASRIGFEHIEAVLDGLPDASFARDLPFGLRAHAEYGTLIISRTGSAPPHIAPALLGLPGSADLGAAGVIEAAVAPDDVVATGPDRISIDADAVGWPLVVDSMREGDRLRPFGMTGTKKVGDLLTDGKVPRRLRGGVPIVRDGGRIVWVAGVRLAEDVRVTPATTRVAALEYRRREPGICPVADEATSRERDDEPAR